MPFLSQKTFLDRFKSLKSTYPLTNYLCTRSTSHHREPIMSDKPNLPLGDIAGYDQGKLKKTEVADKSGVSAHDKLLATVAGGQVNLKVRQKSDDESS